MERLSRSIAAYFAIVAKRGMLCNSMAQSHFSSHEPGGSKTG
jgi:hypothetical protein